MERLLPSYPLWIIDPNFSIWSGYDYLNEGDLTFWTGLGRRTYGLVRYNGATYSFLGNVKDTIKLKQVSLSISAFGTKYQFENEEFKLTIEFLSPLLLDDVDILSCPVCYTKYEIEPNGEIPKDFSICLALNEEYCYNNEKAKVIGGVIPLEGFEAAFMTRRRNLIMSNTYDRSAPDWGDIYLTGESSYFITSSVLDSYIKTGELEYFRNDDEENYIVALNKESNGYFMTAYDDKVSIFYFGEWLKGLFFSDNRTIIDALNYSKINSTKIFKKCIDFDVKLKDDSLYVGKDYYLLACASLRQSVGAHKLVKNKNGKLLFLSKECASNGCIGTVDISYPSIPLYLIYNPELVQAMINGIFEFARNPIWKFDFAPHDLGGYPWCVGQVYGLNNKDDKYSCKMLSIVDEDIYVNPLLYLRGKNSDIYDINMQMPIEECGNMLIMTASAIKAGASIIQASENFDLLEKWANYLYKYGLEPGNQLCTDDFAGHLKNNVNLAIKALVGLESFSIICSNLKKMEMAEEYFNKAKEFANELKNKIKDSIMLLSFDVPNSYSLKYNLLFDKLFGFNLIGQEICEREVDYYLKQSNEFGIPLDIRKDYTKSDWLLWVSALTDEKNKAVKVYEPVINYLKKSPDRIPFGDWFDTKTGEIHFFMNRSVQGGIFAPLLKAKKIIKENLSGFILII